MTTASESNEPNWRLPEHPCAVCGAPTIFLRCDVCFYGARGPLPSARPSARSPRQTLRSWREASGQPSREFLAAARVAYADWKRGELRRQVERGRLGGADDGDEFAATLRALAAAPTGMPPQRTGGWWGMCLWCARELAERSGGQDDDGQATSYWPLALARIRPCARHSAALVRWTRWQRRGERMEQEARELAALFTRHYGFGREDGEGQAGGAAWQA